MREWRNGGARGMTVVGVLGNDGVRMSRQELAMGVYRFCEFYEYAIKNLKRSFPASSFDPIDGVPGGVK